MAVESHAGGRLVGRIPVRNLWLLMLYASDLTRFRGEFNALVDTDSDDLPDLVARLLTKAVERRLKQNLTRGYRNREMVLRRVRGRIDFLTTETHLLLARGEVFCRFSDLTIDTPRNRLVRAAMDLMARLVKSQELAHQCRSLASKVAFELALPTEESGPKALVAPEREDAWVRRLFEKAVLGFARVELEPLRWCVRGGGTLHWQVSTASGGIRAILPRMVTDIVLDPPNGGRRVIVDTKFSSILGSRRFGGASLKSQYLYQMYAYVRSQERIGLQADETAGLFLHPAITVTLYEQAVIQGHSITFATVDLGGSAANIRKDLRRILVAAEGMLDPQPKGIPVYMQRSGHQVMRLVYDAHRVTNS
jgi:5-methylcytosine-specific restriction enzyme subunit McrC